jgi:type I restriction enzyme R subunit
MNQQTLSAFIWSVADLLRGDYKPADYGKVILPFTVLRRLDCVLAPTKAAVLAEYEAKSKAGLNPDAFLKRQAGQSFYNTSQMDLKRLVGDAANVRQNLESYVDGFSSAVRDIFEKFEFASQIDKLAKAKLLYKVAEKFAGIDLHPNHVSNSQMGLVFEELIRKFAELSNETAGEHFTPKAKTLQLFGRPDAGGLPQPFHVYSMRQAIEEGFILDVLKNYTPYKLAFKLASEGKELDEKEVERSAAVKGIMRWVRLHPYNIAQKVQIVVEHFRENVAPLLDDKAKAMVVLASRQEAVRWKLAIDRYIKEQGYQIGTLVAFSGEVNDPESGPEPFSETSATLNPGLKGRDIRDAFKGDEFRLLLVANKFQTGFDQPLLSGMYVDRRLAGIQAVQTLSRLNRAHPGKDTTYILDFVNSSEEVLAAFKTYYDTAELEGVTDPNLIFDLRAKLDATGHYDNYEVDRVAAVLMSPRSTQGDLVAALEPVADRLLKLYAAAKTTWASAVEREDEKETKSAKDQMDALVMFKGDMATFVRVYTFLSQIFDYGNTEIEKRFLFYKHLIKLLEFGREREVVDVSQLVLTHYTLKNLGKRPFNLKEGEAPKIAPVGDAGSGSVQDKQKALLREIIERVNDLFEGDLTDDDRLVYVNNVIKGKLLESDALATQARNNTKAQFANSPTLDDAILDAIMDALDAHQTMSRQALDSQRVRAGLKSILLGPAQLYEALRSQDAAEATEDA